MEKYYTDERNAQVVVSLLKQHGIRKIIASPGATNVNLVRSLQVDPFFEMYSSVDERSAAYLACGLASETGETVVLSCTGATASRNYLPGLTEAFYRKLPVLVITSTQSISRVGHLIPQVIDRSVQPNDTVKLSLLLPIIKDEEDYWDCQIKVNKAILELKRRGSGPVHVNLPTTYTSTYKTTELPFVQKIERYFLYDNLPIIMSNRIAIFIGSHSVWSIDETQIMDEFCSKFNAVVFCDHSSNYKGKYRILSSLLGCQHISDNSIKPDLLIHIGEVSGDYYNGIVKAPKVWRVSSDGEIRDTFRSLENVFEMSEYYFFKNYCNQASEAKINEYFSACTSKLESLRLKLPQLPYSNIWIASQIAHQLPENSVIHFGILNSLRSWNFFELPTSVSSFSNVGGFGIDGGVSSLIGASLSNSEKLFFGVFGDLAFFYDLNVLGNRHVGNNVRIMLVNNGKGTEFRLYSHQASQFGDEADAYIAAAKHFGNKSDTLVKNYASDLGFQYLSASSKNEFNEVYPLFIQNQLTNKPIIFEVFTNSKDESDALDLMMSIHTSTQNEIKKITKNILGEDLSGLLKKIIR